MSNLSRAIFPLIFSFSFISVQAEAASIVYQQSPTSNFADTSAIWNNPSDPGFTWTMDMDEEAWAYFKPTSSASFNRIEWYGSNSDGSFAVDFYAATCVSCGVQFVNTDGQFTNNLLPSTGPYTQAEVHKTLIADGLYSYYIDLPSAVLLNSSNAYYALSIVNNYDSTPFQWASSNTGYGSHVRYIRGLAMVQSAPGNLAFALTDTTAVVPLPASVWLFISGLTGLVALQRKKLSA